MIDHTDYLLAISQVAAAFVGFSMLVSAISPLSQGSELRRSLLYDVAQIGFVVIGGALAPYAISNFSDSALSAWWIASLLLSLTWIVAGTLSYRRNISIAHPDGPSFVLGPLLMVLNPVVVVVGNSLLIWNVVLPDENSGARYQAGLLLLLLIATYTFLKAGFELQSQKGRAQK